MTVQLDRQAMHALKDLRVAGTPWRIRGRAGDEVVVDTSAGLLVWEPQRVTPVYAVPEADLHGGLQPGGAARDLTPSEVHRPVLDPTVPFAAHTAPGEVVAIGLASGGLIEGFRIDDPLLEGYITVDFDALTWFEEDTEQVAHPRDPYQRIDVRPTRRHLVLSLDGTVVADTRRARMLAETHLPVRWYLPEEDVVVPLEPSATVTSCAYKGRAAYRSARLPSRLIEDLFWVYEDPLSDGRDIQGLLGVFTERLDVVLDGVPQPRHGLLRA